MGATLPGASTGTAAASSSVTATLPVGAVAGDVQYAVVESSTVDPHVWPVAWTVVVATLGEAGYVSIAKRTRQVGDTNPTVTNGGHSANWAYTLFYIEGTGGHTPTLVASSSHVDASGVSMTVPAVAEPQAAYTLVWMASATVGDVPSTYPFSFVLGAAGTPLVYWKPFVTPGSPGATITRTTSRPTVSLLLVLQESLSYEAWPLDEEMKWLLGRGYNAYSIEQPAWGGSIQVLD